MAVVESAEKRKREAAFWVLQGIFVSLILCIVHVVLSIDVWMESGWKGSGGITPTSVLMAVCAALFYLGLIGSLRMDGKLMLVGQVGAVFVAFVMLTFLFHRIGRLTAQGSLGSTDCLNGGFYDHHSGYCDAKTASALFLFLLAAFGGAVFVWSLGRIRKAIHILKTLPEPLTRPPSSSTLGFIRTLIATRKPRPIAANPEEPKF